MKSDFAGLLSEKIRTELLKAPGERKITAKSLAIQFDVSVGTILKSLRRLRDEGFLSFDRGKPIQIASLKKGKQSAKPSEFDTKSTKAEERLYFQLQNELLRKNILSGQTLPKFSYISNQYHVSRSTVTSVFKRFEREGVVVKWGRGYKVVTGKNIEFPRNDSPIVCIIQYNDATWELYRNTRWGVSFVRVMIDEFTPIITFPFLPISIRIFIIDFLTPIIVFPFSPISIRIFVIE